MLSQIGSDELNERDYEIIGCIVYEKFSFDELLELDSLSINDSRLKFILDFRTNNYVSDDENILNIQTALEAVKQKDLKLAYDCLNKINGLNISYISKVLYFATRACSYEEYALVFYIRVARSLVKLSVPKDVFEIIEIFPTTKFKHYKIYNSMMHKYARELGVEADSLEMFLFEQK